jgi:PAS domain S-box-containing protein
VSTTTDTISTALGGVCETAARALACTVHASLHPWTSSVNGDTREPGAAHEMVVHFGEDGQQGTLRLARDTPWTDADRALAEGFAGLATMAVRSGQAQLRVAELERHVDEVQALATLGSFEWNVADDRITWSAEQLRIHGLDAESGFQGGFAAFLEFVHPDDRGTIAALTSEMLRQGHAQAGYRIIRPDGQTRRLHARSRVEFDAAGQPARVLGMVQDVTQLLAAEGELRVANELLEQRVAERTAELAAANDELRRAEEHFRHLVEHGTDLVMISGADMQLKYASPSVERMLGYTPQEMLEKRPEDLLHPDDVLPVYENTQHILDNPGTVRRYAWRIRHKHGSWRLIDALGRTINPHSAADGVVCNGRDITEQREAELALQRSEEHFRRLIENGSDLLMISAVDGPLMYVSPSAERLLGYTPAEMLAKVPGDVVHPDDVERVMDVLRAIAAAPGTVHRVIWRIRHRDGSWRVMEALGRTLSPDSGADGIVVNGRDVTEQRAAEAEVVRQRAFFEEILNGIDAGLMVMDAECRFEYASPVAVPDPEIREWLIGRTNEEYVQKRGLAPEIGAERQASMDAVIRTRQPHSFVQAVPQAEGGTRHVMRRLVPVLDEQGQVMRMIGYSVDITERKAIEEQLRAATAEAERARHEAEQANRAKSEFLSRMSHELRTPLNSILGFAQVLEDVSLPPEYRAGVRHILNGGRHLLNLINEVLDIARIEADQQPMSLEPVMVQAAIREAVDMVRPLAAARGIWVGEVPHPAAERYVRADRQRLTQVLLNLLSNAVKYNRAQGTVRIGCEPVRDQAGQERLRIRVTDDGPGIAPERRDQLFVPFARLGAEHTAVEGTGLGLALSQRLATVMGGALMLERSGDEGSTFCVDLQPVANPLAGAPAMAARAERGAVSHPPATLLYVEDNLANLSLVETILLPRPEWRLVPALQGRLGLELAFEHAPDVVLLDLHLPDVHGRDVLRELRADPRTAHTPVVIISADATPRTMDALLGEGADAFLTKPLDVRAFLSTVEEMLARPTAVRA